MYQQRLGARAEYLREEKERMKVSTSLAERFPDLRSLSMTLAYFSPGGAAKFNEIKCTFNLGFAKSLFRFDCPNHECIRGNFDLSAELAEAIAGRRRTLSGETRCQGWRSKTTIDQVHCGHVLRYKLTLRY